MANDNPQITPVGFKIYLENGKLKQKPVYADQFYKLPFWLNVRMKFKRWVNGQF